MTGFVRGREGTAEAGGGGGGGCSSTRAGGGARTAAATRRRCSSAADDDNDAAPAAPPARQLPARSVSSLHLHTGRVIGARGVWHVSRVSRGAPANLACEGRVACLAGLVRGAYLPRFVDAALRTHNHPAATVAGARHVPVGWTALVECVSPTKAGRTQGQCRRDAAREAAPAEARLAPVARGSSSERPGSLYWQTSG